MRRADLLALIRVAGYHDDTERGTRLYVDHRVSFAAYQTAFRAGRAARASGWRCPCGECRVGAQS